MNIGKKIKHICFSWSSAVILEVGIAFWIGFCCFIESITKLNLGAGRTYFFEYPHHLLIFFGIFFTIAPLFCLRYYILCLPVIYIFCVSQIIESTLISFNISRTIVWVLVIFGTTWGVYLKSRFVQLPDSTGEVD